MYASLVRVQVCLKDSACDVILCTVCEQPDFYNQAKKQSMCKFVEYCSAVKGLMHQTRRSALTVNAFYFESLNCAEPGKQYIQAFSGLNQSDSSFTEWIHWAISEPDSLTEQRLISVMCLAMKQAEGSWRLKKYSNSSKKRKASLFV